MKRMLLAGLTTVLAAVVTLVVVLLTSTTWADDETALRVHLVVGAVVVGLAAGAASTWFAPSIRSGGIITGLVVLGLYLPHGSTHAPDWMPQLAAAVLGAVAATALVARWTRISR